MSTPAGDSGGAGGMGVIPPSQQKQQNSIDAARNRVASSLKGGGTVGAAPGQTYSSMGSFPVVPQKASNPKNPNLYMGVQSPIAFMDYSDAVNMYYMWDNKTRNKFMSQLQLAGYDTTQMRDADVAKLWAGYVGVSAQYQVAGKNVTPWDVLGKDIAQRSKAASEPRTVTATQTQYNLSTAEDAAALFQGAAQTLLGRDPTKAEQSRFKAILNKYEKANPATTTTTSTYVGQDLQNQSSTTTGGVSAAAQSYIAQEEAKKNPEYGAYQAATNGMNWLMEMLGG